MGFILGLLAWILITLLLLKYIYKKNSDSVSNVYLTKKRWQGHEFTFNEKNFEDIASWF